MSRHRAIVIGGSLAGLCAARALSPHFDEVRILERDPLAEGTEDRRGLPHGRHVHCLLERGRDELEALFPGFAARMLDSGALDLDLGRDFAVVRASGTAERRPSGRRTLFASRELLDAVVRGLLRSAGNVELVPRTTVAGLVAHHASGRPSVAGVEFQNPGSGGAQILRGNLVVDATGRASKSADWLRRLYIRAPQESRVESFTGFSTRWFKAPAPSDLPGEGWRGIWLDAEPEKQKLGARLFPIEGNCWAVSLVGVGKQYPPSDETAFMRAFDSLGAPLLAQALRLAEPISGVYATRATSNRLRHYERWQARLPGFVAVGDAVRRKSRLRERHDQRGNQCGSARAGRVGRRRDESEAGAALLPPSGPIPPADLRSRRDRRLRIRADRGAATGGLEARRRLPARSAARRAARPRAAQEPRARGPPALAALLAAVRAGGRPRGPPRTAAAIRARESAGRSSARTGCHRLTSGSCDARALCPARRPPAGQPTR